MARRFHRVRHHAGNAARGLKGTAFSIATGAATGAASSYVVSAVPFLSQAWWATPAAFALVGHFVKRKNPAIGDALLGVAGMYLYSGFMTNKSATKGFIDAGAMLPGSSDAGAFPGASMYNDNRMTSASPFLGSAEAAMLYNPQITPVVAKSNAGEFIDAGGGDAMGLSD